MNNEPVAWMCPTGLEYKQRATDFMYNDALYDKKLNWIPLYTHPHPDNLGLAESIIKQQEIQIEALKAEVKQWEEWKESLNGWSKK